MSARLSALAISTISLPYRMQSVQLSRADAKVLAQVFDPESGPASTEILIDRKQPADRYIEDAAVLAHLRSTEKAAIRSIEEYEGSTIKSGQLRIAVYYNARSMLDTIVASHPNYASARNNRAQLRRWYFGDHNMICQSGAASECERTAAAEAVVRDLTRSMSLASPRREGDPVSPAGGKLLAQAHTQLGALYHAAAKDLDANQDANPVAESFEGWSSEKFAEEASRLFRVGGLYGNEVARALAVQSNPHAKLCGNIVKEAMRKELGHRL